MLGGFSIQYENIQIQIFHIFNLQWTVSIFHLSINESQLFLYDYNET